MPVALGLLTLSIVFLYSGITGKGVSELFSGDTGTPLNPAGGTVSDPSADVGSGSGILATVDAAVSGSGSSGSRGMREIAKHAGTLGLTVAEWGGHSTVHHVHVADSWHYRTFPNGDGRAMDVSGPDAAMEKFASWVDTNYGGKVKELFWNGPGAKNRKNGLRVPKGFVSDHTDHVHVAM